MVLFTLKQAELKITQFDLRSAELSELIPVSAVLASQAEQPARHLPPSSPPLSAEQQGDCTPSPLHTSVHLRSTEF